MFFERDNYVYFLRGIKKYLRPHLDILVYSLLPTHYHILGRVKPQPQPQRQTSEVLKTSEVSKPSEVLAADTSRTISHAMQLFGISYTKAINRRFGRVGALFQGQFQSKPIQHFSHLINLCVYIHANPVKDGLVTSPEDWEYSNYLEWMKLRPGTLVDHEFINDYFGTPGDYQALLQEYLQTRHMPEEVRNYLQDLED